MIIRSSGLRLLWIAVIAAVVALTLLAIPSARADDNNGQDARDRDRRCEPATVVAPKHNDKDIVGTPEDDRIDARRAGNNIIYALDGDDIACGNSGNDQIFGGSDADTLFGGPGDDIISGGDDGDVLVGDEGNDTLVGGAGDDTLIGGPGKDRLDGGDGTDICIGTLRVDTFVNCEVVKNQ